MTLPVGDREWGGVLGRFVPFQGGWVTDTAALQFRACPDLIGGTTALMPTQPLPGNVRKCPVLSGKTEFPLADREGVPGRESPTRNPANVPEFVKASGNERENKNFPLPTGD